MNLSVWLGVFLGPCPSAGSLGLSLEVRAGSLVLLFVLCLLFLVLRSCLCRVRVSFVFASLLVSFCLLVLAGFWGWLLAGGAL